MIFRPSRPGFILAASLLACGCTSASPPQDPLRDAGQILDAAVRPPELPALPGTQRTQFVASDEVIDNPERGFYSRVDILKDDAQGLAAATTTLLHSYIRLDPYRHKALPPELLARLDEGLRAVREARKKVIVRFAYNHGPFPNCEPDASPDRILEHIAQVAPVLHANQAVIAWFEAGFIGCWGEWHTSTNGLETNAAAKRNVVAAMLQQFPAKAIQLRYPVDLRLLRGIFKDEAGKASRLGFHHDCVFASVPDDYGTWGRRGGSVQGDKAFVTEAADTAPTGGETCAISPRATCAVALAELQAQQWTDLNKDYNREVLDALAAEGCLETISRNLGYRLALLDAALPSAADPGAELRIAVRWQNQGWAPLYSPRPVVLVLDGPTRLQVALPDALARSLRPGEIRVTEATLALPTTLPHGIYRMALWLPDADSELGLFAAYAIRLANTGVWDPATGVNVIGSLTVGTPSVADAAMDAARGEDADGSPDTP